MAQKTSDKLASTKKWLERNAEIGPTIKAAQAALANAERLASEGVAAKARLAEAVVAKKKAFVALESAVAKARAEKKLKSKSAKIQAKLASLSSKE